MSTSHIYFDLFDFTTKLNDTHVAAQIAQGTAWRIDTLIVAKSRALLREIREEMIVNGAAGSMSEAAEILRSDMAPFTGNTVEAHTAMADAMRSAINEDSWLTKTGLDRAVVEDLTRLTAFRDYAHEQAAELTAYNLDWQGRPRRHEIPDLEEFFHRKQEARVSADTIRKATISSKALAEAEGVDFKVLHERRMARKIARAEELAENTAKTADLAWWTYRETLRSAPTELEAHKRDEIVVTQQLAREQGFAGFSLPLRSSLLQHARSSAQRAVEFAEDDRNMQDDEFVRIVACAMKAQKEIDSVLRSPQFRALSTV